MAHLLSSSASMDTTESALQGSDKASFVKIDGSTSYLKVPFGIKSDYTKHTQTLTLKAKPKALSVTLLDMTVSNEDTGEEVFIVKGKAASLCREMHINNKDGKMLYMMKQGKAFKSYTFTVIDQETSKEVLSAKAKGGIGNDTFDLDLSFDNVLQANERQQIQIQTGITKDTSDILYQGQIAAQVFRATSSLKKSSPCEAYRMVIFPGVDASLMLLSLLCMHVQFVDWKVLGGSVVLAAAGAVGK